MYNDNSELANNMVDLVAYKEARERGGGYVAEAHEASGAGSIPLPLEDLEMADEYVTRGEFHDFAKRTETRMDNLQKEMHQGFLHITERMDEGFQRMDDKFQHLTERMDDKFVEVTKHFEEQTEAANKRQTETRRYLLTIVITAIGAAAGVLALILR